MESRFYVVGIGGGGRRLAEELRAVEPQGKMTLIDADKIEPHNLDRQRFNKTRLGQHKANIVAEQIDAQALCDFYYVGLVRHRPTDWVFSCVDNHPGRLACIEAADKYRCPAILGGNSYTDAEAYIYWPRWRGTKLDPRVYYPELLTDKRGDPRNPCTGPEAQEKTPQLALANATTAIAKLALWYAWKTWIANGEDYDTEGYQPVRTLATPARWRTLTVADMNAPGD